MYSPALKSWHSVLILLILENEPNESIVQLKLKETRHYKKVINLAPGKKHFKRKKCFK